MLSHICLTHNLRKLLHAIIKRFFMSFMVFNIKALTLAFITGNVIPCCVDGSTIKIVDHNIHCDRDFEIKTFLSRMSTLEL